MNLLSGLGIAAFVTATYTLDRRNRKKGAIRNRQDRCARCDTPLDEHPGRMINLSGYLRYTQGRVCAKCYATTRLQDRVFYPLVYASVAILMFISWFLARN
ncbi:MAG: hypothetical protein ABIS07_00150 [Dokdonella sp.]